MSRFISVLFLAFFFNQEAFSLSGGFVNQTLCNSFLSKWESTLLPVKEPDFATFPISSEIDMGKAYEKFRYAKEGIYISIGSERSFRGASMANANRLIILDISPKVLRFARINRELLLAETLEDYLKLRYASDYSEWLQYAERLSMDDFQFWQQSFKNKLSGAVRWELERVPPSPWNFTTTPDFSSLRVKEGNYLADTELYQRLHVLAVEERIHVIPFNLENTNELRKLIAAIKKENEIISVLDLDNLFTYVSYEKYDEIVELFREITDENSMLLIMIIREIVELNGWKFTSHDYYLPYFKYSKIGHYLAHQYIFGNSDKQMLLVSTVGAFLVLKRITLNLIGLTVQMRRMQQLQ